LVIPKWVPFVVFTLSFAVMMIGGGAAWVVWVCVWAVVEGLALSPFKDGAEPEADPMRFPRQIERQGAWRGYHG
jgi:hypothetical protein